MYAPYFPRVHSVQRYTGCNNNARGFPGNVMLQFYSAHTTYIKMCNCVSLTYVTVLPSVGYTNGSYGCIFPKKKYTEQYHVQQKI